MSVLRRVPEIDSHGLAGLLPIRPHFPTGLLTDVGTDTSPGTVPRVFRVMFHEPRIPPNTGNAIRMVAGTGCELHLVGPLGFDLSEPKLKRAGLDYHDLATVTVHENLTAAWEAVTPPLAYSPSPRTRPRRMPISPTNPATSCCSDPNPPDCPKKYWRMNTSPSACVSRCCPDAGPSTCPTLPPS